MGAFLDNTDGYFTIDHVDLNNGLIAYYPFNGNANDESGNGYSGTVYGATLTTDRFGNSDSAYSFDGVDDYIDTHYVAQNETALSFSVWVNLNSIPSTYNAIIGVGGSKSETKDLVLHVSSDLIPYFGVRTPTATVTATSNSPLEVGKWYHIVGTRNDNLKMTTCANPNLTTLSFG